MADTPPPADTGNEIEPMMSVAMKSPPSPPLRRPAALHA